MFQKGKYFTKTRKPSKMINLLQIKQKLVHFVIQFCIFYEIKAKLSVGSFYFSGHPVSLMFEMF